MPAPGVVTRFRPPLGPGVRVDTFVEDGTRVTPYYDSLIAKLVVWDVDRPSAIARAIRALEETVGAKASPRPRELAIEVLRPASRAANYSTSTLAELMLRVRHEAQLVGAVSGRAGFARASVCVADRERLPERGRDGSADGRHGGRRSSSSTSGISAGSEIG